jgi:hypothetical protein
MRLLRAPRARVGTAVALIATLAALFLAFAPAALRPGGGPSLAAQGPVPYSDAQGDELRRQVCTRCHMLPPPDVLPKDRWRDTVARMWLRRDNKPEPLQRGAAAMLQVPDEFVRIGRWYTEHAPVAFPEPDPWPAEGLHAPKFRKRTFSPNMPPTPAIANVQFVDLGGDARPELLVSDMRFGMLLQLDPTQADGAIKTLGQLNNPAHASVVDFDGDGLKDLLVADLGDFLPSDHTKGSVVWMRGQRDGSYVPLEIGGLPRVADVEAADMNGDGRLDLLVGAFGWRKVGHTMLLVNKTTDYSQPSFEPQVIDGRAGPIHLVPVDLDGDGKLDLVELVAQQHERVLAFYNNGPGAGFAMETLYAAPHPNWGFSGMQVVDLDKDGDLDVLLSHGDTLDDNILKPYHGVQWLENKGGFEMVEHSISTMPGVHRAFAVDFDGDGDLDILTAAMIAFEAGGAERQLTSVGYLEQVKPGTWAKRTLERGTPRHATLDAADYDGDGDVDIALGNFTFGSLTAPWIEVWENLTIDKAPVRRPAAAPPATPRGRAR